MWRRAQRAPWHILDVLFMHPGCAMLARLLCAVLLMLTMMSTGAAPSFSATFLPANTFAYTFAYTFNQAGQFACEADFPPGVRHAALWSNPAAPRDLGTLGESSTAQAISTNGLVPGYYTYPDDVPGVAFSNATLYRDGVMLDLNTLVDTQNGLWNFIDAVAINDAQQILVNACTAFGDCRTALLAPVPEPTALVLLLAGLLTIGAGRYAAPRSLLFT